MIKSGDMFGEYRVVKLLGKGGMGEVWLLQIEERREFYAVKILDPELAAKDREFQKRFLREAELAMSIRHRNLIEVFDVGKDPETGLCYILMEYVSGGTLSDLIHKKGSLPIYDAVKIVYQVADVLNCIAKHGIVHRDIKPDNILFDKDGKVKIADLGIARRSLDQHTMTMTQTGVVIGTPAYMAPEQMMDSHHVDIRADIYSLGIVFYEMLAGKRPNEGDTVIQLLVKAMRGEQIPDVRTIRPKISATIAELVNLMCAMDASKRVATPHEVMVVISEIRYVRGLTVRRKLLWRKRKNRFLWITSISAVALASLVWYTLSSNDDSESAREVHYDSPQEKSVEPEAELKPVVANTEEISNSHLEKTSPTVEIKSGSDMAKSVAQQVPVSDNGSLQSPASSIAMQNSKDAVNADPAKLPVGSMPKVGLMVAYDYNDGDAVNYGYGKATLLRTDVAYRDGVAVFDGKYKEEPKDDIDVPDFNYDRFTVAFSFKPEKSGSILRIGNYTEPTLMMNIWNNGRGYIGFSDNRVKNISNIPIAIGSWNWVVFTVDVAKRLALVSVNGKPPVERKLPSDFYWKIPSDKGDRYRRFQFGDRYRSARFAGEIDDLYIYDRALSQKEMLNISRRIPIKDQATPCASVGAGLRVSKPKLVPGKWVLTHTSESSLFWNGTISMEDITIPVRVDEKGIVVSPVRRDLDLSLPVIDTIGARKHIYAVGLPVDDFRLPDFGKAKVVKLPTTLKVLHRGAFSDNRNLKKIVLPESLERIEEHAFAGCDGLESIVIPRKVREIGSFAFRGCTNLKKVEIKGSSVSVDADVFSEQAPICVKMPTGPWTTGPTVIEAKVDSNFEYAKFGRMNQPLFSTTNVDIQFGKKHIDGGLANPSIKGFKFLGADITIGFYGVGPRILAGCKLKWRKKAAVKGNSDEAEKAAKSLLSHINEKLGIDIPPPKLLSKTKWPKLSDKGSVYANYKNIPPIGSSETEHNGYIVKTSVYGGLQDEYFAVTIDIIDSYMFKAWGAHIPEEMEIQSKHSRPNRAPNKKNN